MPRVDGKGRDAARQQGRFESRFTEAQVFVTAPRRAGGPGELGVWTWDGAALERTVGQADVRAIPETVARVGIASGLRLVRCLSGFEGEVWSGGELMSSRWWRSMPSIEEWRQFLIGARTEAPNAQVWQSAAMDEMPRLSVAEWRDDVFFTDGGLRSLAARVRPGQLALAVGLIAVGPMAFAGFKWTAASLDQARLGPELETARHEAQAWLALSRRASRDAEEALAASAFLGSFGLVTALDEFGAAMAEESASVRQIKLDGGSLRLTLDAPPQQDLVAFVSKLESASAWKNVRMESEGRVIIGELVETAPATGESRER